MLKAVYSTHHTETYHDGCELLYAAIVAQAACDVTDKSLSQHDRMTARMWLDARGIDDAHLPAIKKAFTLWKRAREVAR